LNEKSRDKCSGDLEPSARIRKKRRENEKRSFCNGYG